MATQAWELSPDVDVCTLCMTKHLKTAEAGILLTRKRDTTSDASDAQPSGNSACGYFILFRTLLQPCLDCTSLRIMQLTAFDNASLTT